MTHGSLDYGNIAPKQVTYQLIDTAELAVRLGAVNSIDRLGDVIYCDDLSNDIGMWWTILSGAGASIAVDGNVFKNGGFSLKLVGGSTVLLYAKAGIMLTYPEPSRIGFEYNISFDSNVSYIDFYFYLASAVDYWAGTIRLNYLNDKLSLQDSAGIWHDLATSLILNGDVNLFHNLKIVADFVKGIYVRIILDGIVYKVLSYALYYLVGAYNPFLQTSIEVRSKPGVNGTGYLDSIIVTRNEP